MDDETLAAIESRAERARAVRRPVSGSLVWTIDEARTVWESAQDVPLLLAELRELGDELGRAEADRDRFLKALGGTL